MTTTIIIVGILATCIPVYQWGYRRGKRDLLAEIEKYMEKEARRGEVANG